MKWLTEETSDKVTWGGKFYRKQSQLKLRNEKKEW